VNPEERENKQDVIINVTLYLNLFSASKTDALDETVNYSDLSKRIIGMVENSQCQLIERLAERVAELCLEDRKVEKVRIRLDKPRAIPYAASAAVEIFRQRILPKEDNPEDRFAL
jgi:FolB domain-containing protein